MSKRNYEYDPRQQRLFSDTKRGDKWITAARFHCANCNALTVTTAGSLCSKCRGGSESRGGRKR